MKWRQRRSPRSPYKEKSSQEQSTLCFFQGEGSENAESSCNSVWSAMEQQAIKSIQQSLSNNNHQHQFLGFLSLTSIRSLIINPTTSDSMLSSLLHSLTPSLHLSSNSPFLHHTLKLLTDLSSHRPHLSPIILDSLRSNSLLFSSESLTALFSLTDSHNDIDPARFVSLCLRPSVPIRLWLLRNAEKLAIAGSVLLAVFLGFTRDPYPYVRKAALDGLVKICKTSGFDDCDIIEGCYYRAVELLCDSEDCVRSTALCAVAEWGKLLVLSSEEKNKQESSDAIFIQLCSMARDMNMEVRLQAFNAMGMVGVVSEDILLQTLYKKVLVINKDKTYKPIEGLEISASAAAGAFVHGLEDELSEVRMSACYSLRTLTVFSLQFAGEALNLLMDMLNDDSANVRLQALDTMHYMATSDRLNVEEIHMHRFLSTLLDNSSVIRSATRKILKLAKLQKSELFRMCIDGLLGNLESYPQDEIDVFSVLFHIGRNHGKFTSCFVKEVFPEVEPAFGSKLGFDSTRVAGILVLAISAPLSYEKDVHGVPPIMFSFAVTWLGRISDALSNVMNQETLLDYLSECSRSPTISVTGLKIKEALLTVEGVTPTHLCSNDSSQVSVPLWQKDGQISDYLNQKQSLRKSAIADNELVEHDKLRKSVNNIFRKVKDLWSLVQIGCTNEALKAIRACKEEVASFTRESSRYAGTVAFTLQYLRVTKLLAAVWMHLMLAKRINPFELGNLDLLLAKLDRRLMEIRNRFIGLSKDEELQILDLIVVACLLRLSNFEICCYDTALKKLSSTINHVEILCKEGAVEPSQFIVEVKKSLHDAGSSSEDSTLKSLTLKKLLDSFSLQQFVLYGSPRYINAKLEVVGNDSENPLPFIPGLPASIPLTITLHNASSENRLWVRLSLNEECTQFVYVDLNLIKSSSGSNNNEVREFTSLAPFYLTPKATSFSVKVCIGIECLLENVHQVKPFGTPKCELTYLCPEKEVFLCKSALNVN